LDLAYLYIYPAIQQTPHPQKNMYTTKIFYTPT